jgi:uncharacterized protein (UPF0297 family)
VRYNLTPQQLEQFNREMDDHRFEPIQISGYTVNGQSRYAAMFRAVRINKRKTLRYEMDQATFNQVYNELHSQGYVPIQISSFNNGDEITRYAAVWFKSGQEDEGIVVKLELAYDQYIQFILEMQNKKYVLFDEAPSGIFG